MRIFFCTSSCEEVCASIKSSKSFTQVMCPDGNIYINTERMECLYFLNNTNLSKKVLLTNLKEWHKSLGFCTMKDIIMVKGMKIQEKHNFECEICTEEKRMLNKHEFSLEACDLVGLIDIIAEDDF